MKVILTPNLDGETYSATIESISPAQVCKPIADCITACAVDKLKIQFTGLSADLNAEIKAVFEEKTTENLDRVRENKVVKCLEKCILDSKLSGEIVIACKSCDKALEIISITL